MILRKSSLEPNKSGQSYISKQKRPRPDFPKKEQSDGSLQHLLFHQHIWRTIKFLLIDIFNKKYIA